VDYIARRTGFEGAPTIVGTLIVRDRTWTLRERTDLYDFHAGTDGSWIDAADTTADVDDVFNADPLANAWAAALGMIVTQPIRPSAGAGAWTAGTLHVFVDATGARITGISDASGGADAAFVLDAWTTSGGLSLPTRVLRLRNGVPDAGYAISEYRVVASVPDGQGLKPIGGAAYDLNRARQATTLLLGPSDSRVAWGASSAAALGSLLVLCFFAVVWTRRDTIVLSLCRTMARDPRGWRRAGTSIFVEPDGALWFDGMKYRVGPHFYNRAALVQCSILFLRVSAPGVPRATILPRKFRPVDLGVRQRLGTSRGFTLLETLTATALFAAIVLLAIYPALAAVARADAIAAQRAEALVLASNALADEETIDAYDGGAPQGTASTTTDGLTLTVTVTPGSMRGISDLDVNVADSSGAVLVHLTSWLGAPVKSPPHSGGGPPG
jgi:type II secretory pathway pseudopilin PulG